VKENIMIERLKKSSEIFIYICGILLLASVLLISIEVILRKFFLVSFGGADELSGYALGICISWSLAYVLFEKMHIRIDIVYAKMSSNLQKLLDVVAGLFTLAFTGLLVYFSSSVIYTSFVKDSTANTPLGTPLWIPQSIWFLGFCFFFLVLLISCVKSIIVLGTDEINEDMSIAKDEL
jgi:TRAP-type C4-dicarboxylate transport system permease small subunit